MSEAIIKHLAILLFGINDSHHIYCQMNVQYYEHNTLEEHFLVSCVCDHTQPIVVSITLKVAHGTSI